MHHLSIPPTPQSITGSGVRSESSATQGIQSNFPPRLSRNDGKSALFVGRAANILTRRQALRRRPRQAVRSGSVLALHLAIGHGSQEVRILPRALDVILFPRLLSWHDGGAASLPDGVLSAAGGGGGRSRRRRRRGFGVGTAHDGEADGRRDQGRTCRPHPLPAAAWIRCGITIVILTVVARRRRRRMIRHRLDGRNRYARVVSRGGKAIGAFPTNRAVYPENGSDSTAHIEYDGTLDCRLDGKKRRRLDGR